MSEKKTAALQLCELSAFFQDRIDEIGQKLIIRKDYKDITESIIELNKVLKQTLSDEQKRLVGLIDEERGRMLALYEDFYYQGGLIDGYNFWKIDLNN